MHNHISCIFIEFSLRNAPQQRRITICCAKSVDADADADDYDDDDSVTICHLPAATFNFYCFTGAPLVNSSWVNNNCNNNCKNNRQGNAVKCALLLLWCAAHNNCNYSNNRQAMAFTCSLRLSTRLFSVIKLVQTLLLWVLLLQFEWLWHGECIDKWVSACKYAMFK